MTISEQLTQVNTEKQALKTAFTNLGFDMSSVPFTDYHTLLAELVKGVSTTLTSTISSTSVHFGATLTITGTLKDENSTVLTGETITLKDGDNTLNTTTTNSSGAYSFTYTVSSMTSPNLNVAFKSKGFYLSSTSTIPTITVSKADTVITLTANPTTVSSGGSTTLTVTLKDEWGNNLNGETVQILNGTTVLYSGIIASNSFIQTYSLTSTITLKSSYTGNTNYNTSNSTTITLINSLFNDTCNSSAGLSNYTQRTLEIGATTSLTYDSSMNAYKMTASSALGFYGINNLNNLDNFTLTLQLYSDTAFSTGLGFTDLSNGTGLHYGMMNMTYPYAQKYANGTYNGDFEGTSNGSISKHKWYTLTLKKTGTNIILTLTDPENTGNNGTYTTTTSTSSYYGFTCYQGTSYIRNISAVPL